MTEIQGRPALTPALSQRERGGLIGLFGWPLTVALLSLGIWACQCASAADAVKTAKRNHSGTIKSLTSTEVTIETGGKDVTIPLNQVLAISFDKEPAALKSIRSALDTGRNEDAEKAFSRIKEDDLTRADLKQEVDYLRALTTARLALSGTGDLAAASKAMTDFAEKYDTGFRVFVAYMTIGDLLLAQGKSDAAAAAYTKVQEAPWPDYKLRAMIAKGRALLEQDKGNDALALFEEALKLASSGGGDEVAHQKLMATVHKAQALGVLGKTKEGLEIVEDLINKADADEKELYARAYTAAGNCHLKAGNKKEALEAFLHVHLLYPNFAELHAESLANLVVLFRELGQNERSNELRAIFMERFSKTKWASRVS